MESMESVELVEYIESMKNARRRGTKNNKDAGEGSGGGMAYLFVACLSHLTIDHASLSRRSTVPTPNRDTSNVWALITLLPYITDTVCLSYPRPVSPPAATINLLG